jgi:molecular chaperone DnaK (HSP70)
VNCAGLEVLRLVNEPSTAAIANGYEMETGDQPQRMLVFDFGGGMLDRSIMRVASSAVQVLAVDGDSHFGCRDFDDRLVEFCLKRFDLSKEKMLRLNQLNSRMMRTLLSACEQAKQDLSALTEVDVIIDFVLNFDEAPVLADF